ncbi:MAG: tRNA-dihydrouridine synthase [Clostridium sp.]|nr:MAG: tRNA-dihydrouridine synthase [Clostridium sp.]
MIKIIDKPTYKERIDMLVHHYEILKQDTNPRKALLDIKTHTLAYLKYIPNTKELKQKIASSKTEEEFNNCINELYNHIKCINGENNKKILTIPCKVSIFCYIIKTRRII